MAKYDISKEATEDLYRIWDYTVDTWSEEQADIYYGIPIASLAAVYHGQHVVDLVRFRQP